MTSSTDHGDRLWFFSEVERASDRVLFLSHDGALAPGLEGRTPGNLNPGVMELLKQAMKYTRLIVISGSPAHEVAAGIGLEPMPEIWGNDGLERLQADGKYECKGMDVPLELLRALSDYESELDRQGFRDLVEVKLTGIIVRWKGLSPSDQLDIHAKAYAILRHLTTRHPALRMAAKKEGLELRLPVPSRGDAIQHFLSITGPETAIAYVGHSVTDEDSFRILNPRGLTILITPMDRFSAAQIRLSAPEEFERFLRNWVSAAESNTTATAPGASKQSSISFFPRQRDHVSLHRLWAYSQFESRLSSPEQTHLKQCEDCRAAIDTCRHSPSFGSALKELQRRNEA